MVTILISKIVNTLSGKLDKLSSDEHSLLIDNLESITMPFQADHERIEYLESHDLARIRINDHGRWYIPAVTKAGKFGETLSFDNFRVAIDFEKFLTCNRYISGMVFVLYPTEKPSGPILYFAIHPDEIEKFARENRPKSWIFLHEFDGKYLGEVKKSYQVDNETKISQKN